LRASDIKAIVSAAGFTSGDLTEILVTSIDSLMPNPLIVTKLGSGLYGTWALNPDQLKKMLPLLTHKIDWMKSVCGEDNIPFDSSHRTELIRKFSKEYAIQAQKQSRDEFGEASFTIKESGTGLSQVKGGCMTLLMVGGAVGVG
jgi:hypothetical protein